MIVVTECAYANSNADRASAVDGSAVWQSMLTAAAAMSTSSSTVHASHASRFGFHLFLIMIVLC